MSFPASPTFPARFKRPVSSTFPTAPTWPPSSVPPTPPVHGIVLWLRSEEIPIGSVALWKDVSGNGNDATQAVVASQPQGIANQLNGHAAVIGDAVNDILTTEVQVTTSRQYSLFIVYKYTNNGTVIVNGSTVNGWGFYTQASQRTPLNPGVAGMIDGLCTSNFEILSQRYNGSITDFFVNGVAQSITGNTSIPNTPSGICSLFAMPDASLFFGGSIAEILIYPTARSDADRQTVQAYLGTKYAIPVSVPQITQVDFTGLSGVSFVTGGAGLSYIQYVGTNPQGIWFNTGTETQPDLSGHSVANYVQISVNPLGNADSVAEDLKNGINLSGTGNWTAIHNSFTGQCQITDTVNQVDTPAVDINTGAAITVLQAGHPNE